MALGSSNPTTNLIKVAGNAVTVNAGTATSGTQRVILAVDQTTVPVDSTQSLKLLSGVRIDDYLGLFICSPVSSPVLAVGATVIITGSSGATGNITGYTSGTVYKISETNGSTTFKLTTLSGIGIATSPGTPTGLTYALYSPNFISNIAQLGGQTITMGTGVRTAGTQRVTIATDDIVQASQSGTWTVQPGNTVNTTPWRIRPSDGTNDVNIKAASTAASVTDPSLVVALSPNSPLPSGTNGIGKLTANSGVVIGAIEVAASQTLDTVTNLSQLGGQAITMGAGIRTAGTQRVTIATDDIVLASQSGTWDIDTVTNLSQLGGQAITMGAGVRTAGTQRVTIATDDIVPASQSGTWTVQPGNTVNTTPWRIRPSDGTNDVNIKAASTAASVTDPSLVVALSPNSPLPSGTNGIGKLTANSGVVIGAIEVAASQTLATVTNLSQLGGQAVTMGTGIRTAGTQRVTIATDDIVPASQSGTWNVGLNAGTNGIGKLTANSGVVIGAVEVAASQTISVTQATASNLNATVTGTVELGATSLAALENISVTVPGTVDLGTISLTSLETITVTSTTPDSFQSKNYGAVTTAAPSYINNTDNALSLTTSGSLRVDVMSSLPAGTNGIGKLTANSGVTIGAVEIAASQTLSAVTSITNALPAGTNTIGKVEPISPATSPNSNATTTALASTLQIKSSSGTLFLLSGFNSKTSSQFIQIHNATSLIGGAVPVITFTIPPSSNFSFDFGIYGRYFSTGIYVVNSSSAATYTAGSTDCWFDAQYK
jgi:histone H3/H4